MASVTDSRDRRAFLLIVAGGFALRVLWALLVPLHPTSDGIAYHELAWNLATKGSYSWNTGKLTAYWPVGTAFIYSLPLRLFGDRLGPLEALNVLAGTGVLALLMIVARQWVSRPAALAAGALYAVWPSQIEFVSILASELYFVLMVLLAMWAAFAAPIRSWLVRGLLAGLFLALATFIRPVALFMVLVVPLALMWSRRASAKQLALFAAASLAAMALSIAPWTIRNDHVLGTPVLISTNGPSVTWMGNNPNSTGQFMPMPPDVEHLGEVEQGRILGQRANQFIRAHPAWAAELAARKLVLTHAKETIGIVWNEDSLRPRIGDTGLTAAKILSTLYWYAVFALALAGAFLILRRERWRGLIHPALLTWAYFAAVHAVTMAMDRYHFPSIPYIAMLAGVALAALQERLTSHRPAPVYIVDKDALNPKRL